MEQVSATWRKSSYSGSANTGNCVEVGNAHGLVAIRDTKDHGRGPLLRVTAADWHRFTEDVKK